MLTWTPPSLGARTHPGADRGCGRARRLSPPMAQPGSGRQRRDRRSLDHRAKRTVQHLRVHSGRDPPTPRAPGQNLPGRRRRPAARWRLRLDTRNRPRDDPTVRRDRVSPTDPRHPHIAAATVIALVDPDPAFIHGAPADPPRGALPATRLSADRLGAQWPAPNKPGLTSRTLAAGQAAESSARRSVIVP